MVLGDRIRRRIVRELPAGRKGAADDLVTTWTRALRDGVALDASANRFRHRDVQLAGHAPDLAMLLGGDLNLQAYHHDGSLVSAPLRGKVEPSPLQPWPGRLGHLTQSIE